MPRSDLGLERLAGLGAPSARPAGRAPTPTRAEPDRPARSSDAPTAADRSGAIERPTQPRGANPPGEKTVPAATAPDRGQRAGQDEGSQADERARDQADELATEQAQDPAREQPHEPAREQAREPAKEQAREPARERASPQENKRASPQENKRASPQENKHASPHGSKRASEQGEADEQAGETERINARQVPGSRSWPEVFSAQVDGIPSGAGDQLAALVARAARAPGGLIHFVEGDAAADLRRLGAAGPLGRRRRQPAAGQSRRADRRRRPAAGDQ